MERPAAVISAMGQQETSGGAVSTPTVHLTRPLTDMVSPVRNLGFPPIGGWGIAHDETAGFHCGARRVGVAARWAGAAGRARATGRHPPTGGPNDSWVSCTNADRRVQESACPT